MAATPATKETKISAKTDAAAGLKRVASGHDLDHPFDVRYWRLSGHPIAR